MTALWFLYAVAVGVLACIMGTTAERLLRLWRLPVRVVWTGAIVLTLALPLVALLTPSATAPNGVIAAAAAPAIETVTWTPAAVEPSYADRIRAGILSLASDVGVLADRLAREAAPLDGFLIAAWIFASAVLGALLLGSTIRLRRRSRAWRRFELDGVPVLVAPDAGPAVVGGGQVRVVIPDWMLQLDQSLRKMVLRHEMEHIRAGDPQLLLAALAATIAMPWNPALWWQLRRLRTAVELDCDRRVLRVHRDVERYGLLLLAVGQRGGSLLRIGVPALAESTGSLERRIAVMTAPPTRRRDRVVRALLLAPFAAALGAAACMMPSPNAVAGPEQVPPVEQRTGARIDQSKTYFEFQVEKPVSQLPGGSPRYPADLRASLVSGTVIAQFVVDTNGLAESSGFEVLESSDERFTEAVREALPGMRFVPAEVQGRKVRQLVQQPFIFRVDGGTPLPARAPSGQLTPLMRDGERTLASTRAPDLEGRVPLRTDELRPAMRTPAPSGERQRAYFEFEVEKPVDLLPGDAPRYPAEMQAQRTRGEVIAQFVVDAEGRPDPATFLVISSTHDAFAGAVRDAFPTMRFSPAQIAGRRVSQVVQMPFVFEIK